MTKIIDGRTFTHDGKRRVVQLESEAWKNLDSYYGQKTENRQLSSETAHEFINTKPSGKAITDWFREKAQEAIQLLERDKKEAKEREAARLAAITPEERKRLEEVAIAAQFSFLNPLQLGEKQIAAALQAKFGNDEKAKKHFILTCERIYQEEQDREMRELSNLLDEAFDPTPTPAEISKQVASINKLLNSH